MSWAKLNAISDIHDQLQSGRQYGTNRLKRLIRRERPIHCKLAFWCALALCSILLAPVISLYYIKKLLLLLWRMCFPLRIGCCAEATCLRRFIGHVQPIPRIIDYDGICSGPVLPYLQHVESIILLDPPSDQATNYRLPRNLRWLRVELHRTRVLPVGWLPSQLTVLAIHGGREYLLQPGVLPQSLLTLLLDRAVENKLRWAYDEPHVGYQFLPFPAIAAGVLPSQLQWLIINEWQLPMTDLVLPASLTQLDLYKLLDHPIPVGCLPVGLQTLRIVSSSYNPQNLRGALPSSLRELHLHCPMQQPLPASLLAQVPHLEVLDLDDRYRHLLNAGDSFAPLTRLRVLRVGLRWWDRRTEVAVGEPIFAHELPASLRRLIVVPCIDEESPPLDELVLMTASRPALVIEYESISHEDPYNMLAIAIS